METYIGLLDRLHVDAGDLGHGSRWIILLLDTIQSPKGAQYLSNQPWELLVELTISWFHSSITHNPQVMASLLEAQEWDKLECWMGVVWMVWLSKADEMTEHLRGVVVTLFRQQSGAVQELVQWMGRRGKAHG